MCESLQKCTEATRCSGSKTFRTTRRHRSKNWRLRTAGERLLWPGERDTYLDHDRLEKRSWRVHFQRLHIWGSNNQVTAAKKELIRWTKSSQKLLNSECNNPHFTKVRIDSDRRQKMLMKQMEVEAEKQKYRQAPEDSAVFVVHVSISLDNCSRVRFVTASRPQDHMRLTRW